MDNCRFRCCEQVFAISELVIWKWAAGRPGHPRQLGRCAARPAPPTAGLVRPEKGGNPDTLPGPPPGVRSAAGLAGQRRGSAWMAADLRRYRLTGDDRPHLPPPCDAFPAGMPSHLRPGCRAFPPPGPGVSARWVPRVSPGVPWRFRRDTPAFPRDGWRGPPAFPARPSLPARRRSPRGPLPRRVIHFPGPRPTDPVTRPAGGQPLTSGPARVRLTRRMTRRSCSIAVR